MRYYVLTPGSPSYIWAEWATPTRETVWAEGDPKERQNRRCGLGGASAGDGDKILTRDELLTEPTHSEALRRREAKDDATFETQDWARSVRNARKDTERDAANGRPEAAWLLRKLSDPELDLDPESVYDFITGHAHNDCGWSLESV
jgi:hypothetical protein